MIAVAIPKAETTLAINNAMTTDKIEIKIGAPQVWSCGGEGEQVKLSRGDITLYLSFEEAIEIFDITFFK